MYTTWCNYIVSIQEQNCDYSVSSLCQYQQWLRFCKSRFVSRYHWVTWENKVRGVSVLFLTTPCESKFISKLKKKTLNFRKRQGSFCPALSLGPFSSGTQPSLCSEEAGGQHEQAKCRCSGCSPRWVGRWPPASTQGPRMSKPTDDSSSQPSFELPRAPRGAETGCPHQGLPKLQIHVQKKCWLLF